MGEEVIVYPPIDQYISQYTGPEFEEGIMRVLYANLESFAWLWIEGSIVEYSHIENYEYSILETYTHDEISRLSGTVVNLDNIKSPGSYVVSSFINYISGYDDLTPINIFVEYIDNILYMISMVGPDIWYRVYIEENDSWTDWFLQSFCTIHRSIECPEDMSEYDLWLRLPNGERPNYTLFGYYNDKLIEIGGSKYLTTQIYDPDNIQRNVFEYLRIKMRNKLEVLTDHNAPIITSLYNSDCYSKVAYMFFIDEYYYFFINPKDIKIDSQLSRNKFYVIRYDKDFSDVKQFEGLAFNIINAKVSRHNRIYILNESGDVYHSNDAIVWYDLPISYTTNEYLSKYEYLDLRNKTNAEVENLKSSDFYYGEIEHLDSISPGFIYLFTKNDDFLVEQDDLIFKSFKRNGIPSDFLVKDMIIWHDKLLALGYYEDGTVSNCLYVSSDEGKTWKFQPLPSYRHWSHFYLYDDILIISTDELPDDKSPQTYYAEFNHDIENIIWNIYEVDIGSSNIVNVNDIPIRLIKNENGIYQVEYITRNSISTIKTIYRFLHRYMHMELNIYTHDEIKELQRELNDVFHTITFSKYGDNVIEGSLTDLNNDRFGFLFENEDGTLGFQGLHFISYGEDFEYHIHDEERHMTQEERDKIMNFVTRDKANELLDNYKNNMDDYVEEQNMRLDFSERFNNIRDIVNRYVVHASDTTIHVTPEQKEIYDSKANDDHVHNLDGKIKLDAKDIIGMISPSTLPKESQRRMIKVKSIDDMYKLDRDTNFVYNGFCIHVLSDEENIDENLPLRGRFFWVLDDSNLNSPDSYIEFTVTNDDILIYWNEITGTPITKDGYNITDSPSIKEFHDESIGHDKLEYGFDLIISDSIERDIKNADIINSASKFLSDNKIQNIPERITENMETLMQWMNESISNMHVLPINTINVPNVNIGGYVSIIDIQYSIKTGRYYVYMVTTDELSNLPITYIITYTDDWKIDRVFSTENKPSEYGGIIVYPLSESKELWMSGPQYNEAYVYDLDSDEIIYRLPEECVNLSRDTVIEIPADINGYSIFVIVNKEHKLGILKIEGTTGNYDYRLFSNPIIGVEVITSIYYDTEDDKLYIIGMSGINSVVLCYYGMSMLFQSFKYFDVVDRYIENPEISSEILFSDITPEKTIIDFSPKKWNVMRYLGKWDNKYIMIIHNSIDGAFVSISDKINVLNPKFSLNCESGAADSCYVHIFNKPDIFPYNGKTYIVYNPKAISLAELISPYKMSNTTMDCDIEGYSYIVLNGYNYYQNGQMPETDCLRQFSGGVKCYCITDDNELNTKFQLPNGITGTRFCNGIMYSYGQFNRLMRFSPDAIISSDTKNSITILSDKFNNFQVYGNMITFGNGYGVSIVSLLNLVSDKAVMSGESEILIRKAPYIINKFGIFGSIEFHMSFQIGRIANSCKGILCASIKLTSNINNESSYNNINYIKPYEIDNLQNDAFLNDPYKTDVCGLLINGSPVLYIIFLKDETHLSIYKISMNEQNSIFEVESEVTLELSTRCTNVTILPNSRWVLCYSVSNTGSSTYFKINSDGTLGEQKSISNVTDITDLNNGTSYSAHTFGKLSSGEFLCKGVINDQYMFSKFFDHDNVSLESSNTPSKPVSKLLNANFPNQDFNYRKCMILDTNFGFFVIECFYYKNKVLFVADKDKYEENCPNLGIVLDNKENIIDVTVVNGGSKYSYFLISAMVKDDISDSKLCPLADHLRIYYIPNTTDTILDTYKSNVALLQSSYSVYTQMNDIIKEIDDIM